MQKIFFTADTHYGHANIIKYCNRPFSSVEEMNSTIVDRFNQVWEPGAILYHLGDIALNADLSKQFLDRLLFKQVFVIWGNHDKQRLHHPKIIWNGDMKYIKVQDINIVLCHYPLRSWQSRHHGSYHLYGHVHGSMPGIGRSKDVGVDTNNMFPYSYEEINEKLQKIPIDYIHHAT